MKNSIFLFLFLIPVFLFAQYPTGTNKSRLGYQTTGDGLIWRGVAADTAIKPRTNANAYFQLDTVNRVLRLYIATQGSWQVVGATPDLSAYLLKSDTAAMLVKYIERGDTATMLAKYIERGDTAAMLANYPTFGDVATSLGNYLPIIGGTLTGTGGAGFIGFPSQITAPGTPASGLNVYAQGSSFNWKGTDGYERQFASTLTGGRTYTLPDVSGTFALGTGTADRLARWTGTNTLAAGNLTDNGTKLQALLPWQFHSWTTAGRPTGVNNYWGYNSTTDWLEGYLTSAGTWVSPMQTVLIGGKGTAGRVLYTDANGRATDSGNLTYTGTRFQTGGSIRIGYNNVANDTASIEKVIETNSKVMRLNSPGGSGGFNGGFVFRGGQNGTVASVNTFRMYTNSTTVPGSVYIGNVTEPSAQSGNATTIFGILNKITSSTAYDAAINVHANETGAGANYSLALGKQLGIQIGNNYSNTNFQNFTASGFFGVFIGYQRQPLTSGYGSSMVLSAHGEAASTTTEVMRLQGKDGNICLGCTNAQYQLYTSNTGAYGIPRGTVAERPTIIASTTPIRYNTDSTALEYGESVGTWRQLATRAYARSLVSALPTTNIYTANGSLTADRTLHGAGHTLRFNANTIVRDSFKVANLIEPADADSIVITKGGWIGKQKFLLKNYIDSLYTYGPNGFFSDKYASGFMSSRDENTSLFYADTTGFVEISNRNIVTGITSAIYTGAPNGGRYITIRQAKNGRLADFAFSPSGFDYTTSGFQFILKADTFGVVQIGKYGAGVVTPTYAGVNRSNYIAGFATNGTLLDLEQKRDTTIYVVDTDYDFSAALTTSQVSRRYNRIIFLMTTTAGAGSDSELTLHTPDSNLMQVEYLIRSTDETGGFTNVIKFGTNNAVASDNALASTYTPSPGQGVGIRAGLRSGVYKYFYY